MWILFLVTVFVNGFIFNKSLRKKLDYSLPFIFSFGSLVSIWSIYILTSFLTKELSTSLLIYFFCCIGIYMYYFFNTSLLHQKFIDKKEIIFFLSLTVILLLLFNRTFSYDIKTGEFLVASHLYLDFGAHIPFIRSFSLGNNFPFEVPFFANNGLSYHFLFNLYAGILEYLGLRLDIALNLISAFSFSALVFSLVYLSFLLFKHIFVGLIATVLLFFNSSLSYVYFIKDSGLRYETIISIWHNTSYLGNAPFDGGEISVFWNINTFLNQRHLIFAIAFFLITICCIYEQRDEKKISFKKILILSLLIGIVPFWHISIFIALVAVLVSLFVIDKSSRKFILYTLAMSSVIALPHIYQIKIGNSNQIVLKPGFLVSDTLLLKNFVSFWVKNLGFSMIASTIGFYLSSKKAKLFYISLFSLFLLANIFQLNSRFMFDNHKFFNVWIIGVNLFSAYLLMKLFHKGIIGKFLACCLLLLLTGSGLLNIIVAKNDQFARVPDYPAHSLMQWTKSNIAPKSIVVTNGEIYDPASLVGRKTVMGRAHYVFIYGGNPDNALQGRTSVLNGNNIPLAKSFIQKQNVKYIIIYKEDQRKNFIPYNVDFLTKQFKKIYEDKYGIVFKT